MNWKAALKLALQIVLFVADVYCAAKNKRHTK